MQLSEVKNAIDKRKTAYFDGIECFVVGYQLLNLNGNKIYSVGLQEKKNKRTLYWAQLNKVKLED